MPFYAGMPGCFFNVLPSLLKVANGSGFIVDLVSFFLNVGMLVISAILILSNGKKYFATNPGLSNNQWCLAAK